MNDCPFSAYGHSPVWYSTGANDPQGERISGGNCSLCGQYVPEMRPRKVEGVSLEDLHATVRVIAQGE